MPIPLPVPVPSPPESGGLGAIDLGVDVGVNVDVGVLVGVALDVESTETVVAETPDSDHGGYVGDDGLPDLGAIQSGGGGGSPFDGTF